MIKFRQKEYTIQEGQYTGPKSIKKIPGTFKVITKSILAGLGIGAGTKALLPEETIENPVRKGAKAGFWAGVALKMLINNFHKPMSSVKFEKVDKAIRKEYGIKEVSGMIYGDSKEVRDDLNSHFSFNDPDILGYRANLLIQKKRVILYIVDFSKDDLAKLNESLDYFCYKYYGMEYSSKLLNHKRNSFSISIIFTNYEALAKFFIEISRSIGLKIIVLDKDSDFNENQFSSEDKEKTFSSSLPTFDKYDIIKILGKGGIIINKNGFKTSPSDYLMDSLSEAVSHFGKAGKIMTATRDTRLQRQILNNLFLEKTLKELGYKENLNYTVKRNNSPLNMYLHEGYLIICSGLVGKNKQRFEKEVVDGYKLVTTEIKGKVTLYTYLVKSKLELDLLLRDLINLNIKPNIYTK